VAVICGAFVAGCNHGQSNKQEVITQLTEQRDAAMGANKEWKEKADEANRQVEANKRFAKEQMVEAEALAKELSKQRQDAARKQAKLTDQLNKALEEPECTELLKAHFCSAVPLPAQP
jgi:hypothetical protein